MGAIPRDMPLFQYQYSVAEAAGAHSMGDEDGGLPPNQIGKMAIHLGLCQGIQSCRGLVQNGEGGFVVDGPRYGQLLPLSTGEVSGILVDGLIQVGVES